MEWTDPAVFQIFVLTLAIGLFSGLMGSFVVLKRMSLLQDVLGHAVFPGLLVGFLLAGKKDHPLTYIVGFLFVLGASLLIYFFTQAKLNKKFSIDSAQGVVLAGAFSVGIFLFSYIDSHPRFGIEKNGLKDFMFGQLVSVTPMQAWVLFGLIGFFLMFGGLSYRSWAFSCFDPQGARVMGVPAQKLEIIFFVFQAFFMTIALQVAGLVLIAGLLVVPAAMSLLISRRWGTFVIVSSLLGGLGTLLGVSVSYYRPGIPSGPAAVLAMFLGLCLILIFQFLRRGLKEFLQRVFNLKDESSMRQENTLKAIYQWFEMNGFKTDFIEVEHLAAFRNITVRESRNQLRKLARENFILKHPGESRYTLTPQGWIKAIQIIRAHRLWELYLLKNKTVEERDVHFEAEFREHLLSPEQIAEVESSLNYPKFDPHGKSIPGAWHRRKHQTDQGES